MKKIDFKSLPDKSTPLNPTNLNGMQNNIEESAVIVSSTEPQTNEKVWFQKSNNLLEETLNDKNVTKQFIALVRGNIYLEEGKEYTISFDTNNNGGTVYAHESTFFNNEKIICDGTRKSVTVKSKKNGYVNALVLASATNVTTPYNIRNVQIEPGNKASLYQPYIPNKILIKNLNGVFEEFYDEENKENYSLEEQKIGTWVDGKPLYQKTIIMNNVKLNAPNAHNILNINEVIDIKGVFLLKNGFTRPLDSIYIANNNIDVTYALSIYFVDKTNIEIRAGRNVISTGIQQLKITLQYTKTTN